MLAQGPLNLRHRFQHTWSTELDMAYVVAGLVLATLVFALVRSFTPWGKRAKQKYKYHVTETVYVGLVAAAAAFLIFWSFSNNSETPDGQSHVPYKMTVDVLGYQWCWRFAYVGTPVSVTGDCVNGHYPTLVVPSGESIRFNVESADVIHGFWIPYMRFKIWAYPDHVNSFENTFSTPGTWQGECSEFCGQYHYAMKMVLHVVTPAQYKTWLAAQEKSAGAKPAGPTGLTGSTR